MLRFSLRWSALKKIFLNEILCFEKYFRYLETLLYYYFKELRLLQFGLINEKIIYTEI